MSIAMALQTPHVETNCEAKLIAQVFRQDEQLGEQFVMDIQIPLVHMDNNTDELSIDELESLEPGQYLLQVSLPNGDIITKGFRVRANKDTELLIDLPQQDLNNMYAHTVDIEESIPGKLKQKLGDLGQKLGSENLSYKLEAFLKQADNYSLFLISESDSPFLQEHTIKKLSQLIHQTIDVQAAHEQIGTGKTIKLGADIQGNALSLRIKHPEEYIQEALQNPEQQNNYLSDNPQRQYLIQKSDQSANVICLPTPWYNQDGQANIQFLVDIESENSDPTFDYFDGFNYSITLNDPMIDSALSYVNTGALYKAAMLIDSAHAQKMLYSEVANPFAALMGGYLLVLGLDKTSFQENQQDWMQWVKDLDEWYPWLPDGAILHASMHLMLSNLDNEKTYQILMRAYQRGLPVFSYGLKLMIDAMRHYANQGDEAAKTCLLELETIAMYTDPAQPFLSITFANTPTT